MGADHRLDGSSRAQSGACSSGPVRLHLPSRHMVRIRDLRRRSSPRHPRAGRPDATPGQQRVRRTGSCFKKLLHSRCKATRQLHLGSRRRRRRGLLQCLQSLAAHVRLLQRLRLRRLQAYHPLWAWHPRRQRPRRRQCRHHCHQADVVLRRRRAELRGEQSTRRPCRMKAINNLGRVTTTGSLPS